MYWNPWWKDKSLNYEIKNRDSFQKIEKLKKRKEIVFINGVRRSGKTSALYYIINNLIKNKTKQQNILYLNLDDESFTNMTLDEIYENYRILFPDLKEKIYVFLDEIQNISNWERWVKAKYDSYEDIKFFITGSNASLLKKKSSKLLTGRMFSIEFFPLNFKEFLNFKNIRASQKIDIIENKTTIKKLFKEYLKFGGFPEVINETEEDIKYLILKNYYEQIRDRDIIKEFGIKEIKKFENLTFYLVSNYSSYLSAKSLSGPLELSTSIINNYFDYTELVYFFLYLKSFSYSIKGQITSQRKCYSIDTGFLNAISYKFSENIGKLIENLVFLELIKHSKEIYYYKETYECDFILKENQKITQAIQVSKTLQNEETKKREIKGLIKALKRFKLNKGIILTYDEEQKITSENYEIIIIPIWKWCLQINSSQNIS